MNEPPFVAIYEWLADSINAMNIDTFSASQEVPKKMPVCRVQMLNSDATNQFHNAREYNYTFQIDVVDAQNKLVRSLTNAYRIMQLCRQADVSGYAVGLSGEPSLSSMVDTSTNQILNRQIIRVNFVVIEDTAF